jgi:hypothetical protein
MRQVRADSGLAVGAGTVLADGPAPNTHKWTVHDSYKASGDSQCRVRVGISVSQSRLLPLWKSGRNLLWKPKLIFRRGRLCRPSRLSILYGDPHFSRFAASAKFRRSFSRRCGFRLLASFFMAGRARGASAHRIGAGMCPGFQNRVRLARWHVPCAFMVTNPGRVTALRTQRGHHPPSVCCTRLSTLPRSEVATHEFDIFLIRQCLFRV